MKRYDWLTEHFEGPRPMRGVGSAVGAAAPTTTTASESAMASSRPRQAAAALQQQQGPRAAGGWLVLVVLALAAATAQAWVSSFVPRQGFHTITRGANRRGGALQMKIQWDPYTGQFIDIGDDEPIEEIGVPARNPAAAAPSAPTGLETDELKIGGGSVAKANAYLAQKMAEDVAEGVDALMKELDELAVEGLAPGEAETWPAMTDPMKRVLQTEQQANLETVRRNVDIARAAALLVSPGKEKQSPLAPALMEAFRARGAPAPRLVSSDSVSGAELEEASVLVLLPEAKDGPKLPFGGGGGGAMLEANQVEDLLTKAAAKGNLRHVVYVSSVGAEKAGFQFTLDSLGGSLEKKKAAEQAVRRLAKTLGFCFSIVRVGGLGAAKAGEEGVALEPADSLTGATSVDTAAQAVVQSLALPSALNATFSIVNTKGPAPTDEEWRDNMLKLVGPEVLRRSIKLADVQDMRMSLRAWALQYMEGERRLTTKVFAVRTPLGAKVYFLPTMNVLGAGFREEKAIEKARMKGDGALGPPKPTRPVLEGGLEVCVDDAPLKRVRVRRIAMEEGTVVKAMSEKELLQSLVGEIEAVEALAAEGKRVVPGAAPPSSSSSPPSSPSG